MVTLPFADWYPTADHDVIVELGRLHASWLPMASYYACRPNEPDLGLWDGWVARKGLHP